MGDVMERRERYRFALSRFANFLKRLMHSGKAVFGISIILFFTVLALFPQFFTLNTALGRDPETHGPVARKFAAPAWLRNMPTWLGGNPQLTESFRIMNDPGLPSLVQDGGELEFLTNYTDVVTAEIDRDTGFPFGFPFPKYEDKNGSLAVYFRRNSGQTLGNVKLTIIKRFYYPYIGLPAGFVGNVELLVSGTTYADTGGEFLDVPLEVKVFLASEDGKRWILWPPPYNNKTFLYNVGDALVGFSVNYTTGEPMILKPFSGRSEYGGWIISRPSASSGSTFISDAKLTRLTMGLNVNQDPAPVIFTERPGNYSFGIEITFIDNEFPGKSVLTKVNIDDFFFEVVGNSYGIMGTDHQGYDLWAQLVYGTRISLYLGISVSVMSILIGLLVGLAAGYLSGAVDQLLMRFNDVMLCLPTLPLLIVLAAVLGHSIENLMVIMVFLGWNGFARVVRSMTLSLKERPFVEAAKAVGAGRWHVISKHIIPNVMSVVYVSLATAVPGAVTAEAALSWLGFYDPTRMSWGRMLNNVSNIGGSAQALINPLWPVLPGLFIALLASSFILLGYALDEVLNPKLRMRR